MVDYMRLPDKREYLYRTILVLCSIVISIIIIGSILNIFSHNPEQTATLNKSQASQYIHHPAPWYNHLAIKSVDMHAVLEPFSEDYAFDARHNSQGFRTPEYTTAKPPETFRIVVIGDSFTWGQGVMLEDTFSFQLSELLKKNPNKKFSIEVIALGVRGSRLIDNFIRLQAHAKDLNPDLIIIQFLQNDLEYYSSCKYLIPKGFAGSLFRVLSRFNYLRKILLYFSNTNTQKKLHDPKLFEWNFFVSVLENLNQWKKQNNAELFFISFPSLGAYKNGIDFSEYAAKGDFTFFQDVALSQISKSGFDTLNLFETYKKHAERNDLFVSDTDSHPSAFAHKMAADALYNYLIENQYIQFTPLLQQAVNPLWETESVLRQQAEENWADYNKSYEKQLFLYKALKNNYPKNPWITSQLAFVYKQTGDYEKSYALYESLLSLSPEIAAPWYHMAECAGNDGDKIRLFKKVLDIIPDHSNAMERLADIYKQNGRYEEACKYYQQIANVPRYPEQLDKAIIEIEALCQ